MLILFTASSSTIGVLFHKVNSEKSEPSASNADTSIASVETSDNPRSTKDKTKRIVATVSVDESVTTPSKVIDGGAKTVNNEIKDDNTAEIEAQLANQGPREAGLRSTDENNGQNAGAAVTETAVNTSASSTNRKWRHVSTDCLACVRTRPPSSHELREAFFAGKAGKNYRKFFFT